MIRLTSEIDREYCSLMPVDIRELIQRAIAFADLGMWDAVMELPDGRRITVRKFVKMYSLTRLVNWDAV